MKKIKSDLKKGFLKIKPENKEDLWYISRIIDSGDLIRSKTTRKIKIGDDSDKNVKVVKKTLTLEIKVEKLEFSDNQDILRINGTITQGPDDISYGSHHSINVEEFSEISITKEKWLKFQLDTINESVEKSNVNILMIVLDREEAYFAKLKNYGYEILSNLKGSVQKKAVEEKVKGNFYKEIINQIEEYEKREKYNKIIIASPSFWKEDLMKNLDNEEFKKKIVLATCSTVDKNSFDEILKRDELKTALKDDKITQEILKVEELLSKISTEGAAVYGEVDVIKAGNSGAIKELLISDTFIHDKREKEDYKKIEDLMKIVDNMKGDIIIVSHKHDGGQKLDGLGGIGAITRYKIV